MGKSGSAAAALHVAPLQYYAGLSSCFVELAESARRESQAARLERRSGGNSLGVGRTEAKILAGGQRFNSLDLRRDK